MVSGLESYEMSLVLQHRMVFRMLCYGWSQINVKFVNENDLNAYAAIIRAGKLEY